MNTIMKNMEHDVLNIFVLLTMMDGTTFEFVKDPATQKFKHHISGSTWTLFRYAEKKNVLVVNTQNMRSSPLKAIAYYPHGYSGDQIYFVVMDSIVYQAERDYFEIDPQERFDVIPIHY